MPHSIVFNSEEGLIEMKVEGDFFLSEVKDMVTEVVEMAKEQNSFLLFTDTREASWKLSTIELYRLPQTMLDLSKSLGISASRFKRAVVATSISRDHKFFETVSLNSSQLINFFLDKDNARKWLLEK